MLPCLLRLSPFFFGRFFADKYHERSFLRETANYFVDCLFFCFFCGESLQIKVTNAVMNMWKENRTLSHDLS